MYRLLTISALLALTAASPQIFPLPSTTTRSPNDVPNISAAPPNNASAPLPIVPIASVTNHVGGPGHNLTTGNNTCVTVTAQGEPMFTIQTDTALHSCTVTVPAGPAGGPAAGGPGNSTTTPTGGPAVSGSGAAGSGGAAGTVSASGSSASSSSNPANRVVMGAEGLGLAVFVGALGLL